MNKIIIKYFLLCLVVFVFLIFLFKDRSPFGKNNTTFSVTPGKEITRMEFSEGDKKLILEKKGANWLVNNKSESRKSAILFMIRILNEIKIKSPVTSEIFYSEVTEKAILPFKVKIFENRKLIKTFNVYKTGSNKYGNIMKMRDNSKPFIVYVPGYEGNIGSNFMINELFWQPYMVFNLLPSEIESVNVENISDPGSSFLIINKTSELVFSDMVKNVAGWDTSRVNRYLTYYYRIALEKWSFELTANERKKIESGQLLFRITVTKRQGEKIVLTLWERWITENGIRRKDSDRLWAKTDRLDEVFVMRYFDIDPILKKKSYFFME